MQIISNLDCRIISNLEYKMSKKVHNDNEIPKQEDGRQVWEVSSLGQIPRFSRFFKSSPNHSNAQMILKPKTPAFATEERTKRTSRQRGLIEFPGLQKGELQSYEYIHVRITNKLVYELLMTGSLYNVCIQSEKLPKHCVEWAIKEVVNWIIFDSPGTRDFWMSF